MSILNRQPMVPHIDEISDNNKEWTVIFFDQTERGTEKTPNNLSLEKYFFETTHKFLKDQINVEKTQIYAYQNTNNLPYIDLLNSGAEFNEIQITIPKNSLLLLIIKKYLDMGKNIIFITYPFGLLPTNKHFGKNINSLANIHSFFSTSYEINDNMIELFSQKLGLEKLLLPYVLLIPFTQQNSNFINSVSNIANKIKTENSILSATIALSLVYGKNVIKIIDLVGTIFGNTFVQITNKSISGHIREVLTNGGQNMSPVFPANFDTTEYIFYPYLDVDTEPTKISFEKNMFNTNGFYYEKEALPQNYYQKMFKRFDDKNSGLFVQKNKKNRTIIIPKILHHVWLDPGEELSNMGQDHPAINYTNAWGRSLNSTWQYKIWTEKDLFDDALANGRENEKTWRHLYNREKDYNIKLLISYLAILEKYGGIVINSFTIPLKSIPDELLQNKIWVSFADELNLGTRLSFRIMGSVPGEPMVSSMDTDETNKIDVARRPFEGKNNFFRNIREKNKIAQSNNNPQFFNQNNQVPNSKTILPDFFRNIYTILENSTTTDDKFGKVEKIFLSDPNMIIYPSYYFNPNNHIFSKKLSDQAICINLWKPQIKEPRQKTELKRTYIIPPKSIIAKLNEDPKDRIKNSGKL